MIMTSLSQQKTHSFEWVGFDKILKTAVYANATLTVPGPIAPVPKDERVGIDKPHQNPYSIKNGVSLNWPYLSSGSDKENHRDAKT
jgi:hypothetical protein